MDTESTRESGGRSIVTGRKWMEGRWQRHILAEGTQTNRALFSQVRRDVRSSLRKLVTAEQDSDEGSHGSHLKRSLSPLLEHSASPILVYMLETRQILKK